MKRNLFFGFLALMLTLWSCEKDQVNTDDSLAGQIIAASEKTPVPVDALPMPITEDIALHNFETFIEEAWKAKGLGFEVVLGDEEVLYYNLEGRRLQHSRRGHIRDQEGPCMDRGKIIPKDRLPEAIIDYIAENYPDHEIRIGKTRFGKILVLLQPRLVLVFDADGNFIEEGPGFIFCSLLCKPVPVKTLPEAVTSYVSDHYPGAEIVRACIRRGEFLTVGLRTPKGPVVLVFDKEHNFLFSRP